MYALPKTILVVQKISVFPNIFWGYRKFSVGVAHLRIFLYPQNNFFLGVHTHKKNTALPFEPRFVENTMVSVQALL